MSLLRQEATAASARHDPGATAGPPAARFEHACAVCGAFGAFGFGTYAGRRPGWPGGFVDGPRWYCAAHRADGEAAHAARRAAPPAGADTKQGGLL